MHVFTQFKPEHEANLRTLANYLLNGELKADFNMRHYTEIEISPGTNVSTEDYMNTLTTCGTVGCAIGHAPFIGIKKDSSEDWGQFSERAFGMERHSSAWDWCFSSLWTKTDNTPEGAAKRILYLLKYGFPDDGHYQMWGFSPLCYNQIEVYEPTGTTFCYEESY